MQTLSSTVESMTTEQVPPTHERTKGFAHPRGSSRPLRRPRPTPGSKQTLLATNPRDLERFVDSHCRFGTELVDWRGSRMATSTATSISWDGLTLDPRPFARFDEHDTLTCGRKPAGSAGSRVIELEGHTPGGIFGRPATGPGRMQWTVEQETSRVLAPDNPFKQAAADEGGVAVERPYFDSALAVVPKVQAVRPPTCILRAGPLGDRALLAPEERRDMNDYETKMQAAERLGRKARHQKTRLEFIMRHRYPEGAIGVDSPYNPASEVHAERRMARENREAASSAQAAARRQRLDEIRGNPRPRFGYDPWQHPDLPESGGIQQGVFGGAVGGGGDWGAVKPVHRNGGEHFFQSKAKVGTGPQGTETMPAAGSRVDRPVHKQQHGDRPPYRQGSSSTPKKDAPPPRSETFVNILGMREKVPKADPAVRAQALWDEGCGRRPYNIVSHARLPLPAARAERPPGRLAHPSQQSLERGRNLQASLIPA